MIESIGYWVKIPSRCDYCHHSRKELYMVKEGPTTGKFCSRAHYELAKKQMEEHEDVSI